MNSTSTTLGVIGYAIISELFGSNSDTHIFGDALEKVRNHEKVSMETGASEENIARRFRVED